MQQAPRIDAQLLGSGHDDLRASGQLVWCRKCGRYGEGNLRSDGLGGPCKGVEARNATQFRLLTTGWHPQRRGVRLPPDVAFHR